MLVSVVTLCLQICGIEVLCKHDGFSQAVLRAAQTPFAVLVSMENLCAHFLCMVLPVCIEWLWQDWPIFQAVAFLHIHH